MTFWVNEKPMLQLSQLLKKNSQQTNIKPKQWFISHMLFRWINFLLSLKNLHTELCLSLECFKNLIVLFQSIVDMKIFFSRCHSSAMHADCRSIKQHTCCAFFFFILSAHNTHCWCTHCDQRSRLSDNR